MKHISKLKRIRVTQKDLAGLFAETAKVQEKLSKSITKFLLESNLLKCRISGHGYNTSFAGLEISSPSVRIATKRKQKKKTLRGGKRKRG